MLPSGPTEEEPVTFPLSKAHQLFDSEAFLHLQKPEAKDGDHLRAHQPDLPFCLPLLPQETPAITQDPPE